MGHFQNNVNGSGDGKKRGNNGSDHHDDKRAKSISYDKYLKYEPQFTNYTTLSTSRTRVYLAIYQEVPFQKPTYQKVDEPKVHEQALQISCRLWA